MLNTKMSIVGRSQKTLAKGKKKDSPVDPIALSWLCICSSVPDGEFEVAQPLMNFKRDGRAKLFAQEMQGVWDGRQPPQLQ